MLRRAGRENCQIRGTWLLKIFVHYNAKTKSLIFMLSKDTRLTAFPR